jgi:hypothetical protein
VGALQSQLRKQGGILSEDDINRIEAENKASNKTDSSDA